MSAVLKVSVIYALADPRPFERLMVHLAPLALYDIQKWVVIAIRPDLNWKPEISERFLESDLVLYLVSPDSLQPFCYEEELLTLKKKGSVFPVLMRDALESPILADIQALPHNAISVFRSAASAESRLAQLAKEIRREVTRLRQENYQFDSLPISIDSSARQLLGQISVESVDRIIAAEISRALARHLSQLGDLNRLDDIRLNERLLWALTAARDRIARQLRFYHPQSADQVADAVFVQWAIVRGVISDRGERAEGASALMKGLLSFIREIAAEPITVLNTCDTGDSQLPLPPLRATASMGELLISSATETRLTVNKRQPMNALTSEGIPGARHRWRAFVGLPRETKQLAA